VESGGGQLTVNGIVARPGHPAARTGARPPRPLVFAALAVAAMALLPFVYLVVRGADADADAIRLAFRFRTLELLRNTLALSIVVGAGAIALGLPTGWLTSRTDLPARRWFAVLTVVPLAIPSYVLAFALIGTAGPRGALSRLLAPLGIEPIPSIYGFGGAAFVLILATYPYVTLAVRAALRRTDAGIDEAARTLGDSSSQAFRRITLPILLPAVTGGALLSMLYALADFGSVSLLQFDSFARVIYVAYRAAFDRSLAALLALMLAALALGLAVVEAWARSRQPPSIVRAQARPAALVPLGAWRWPAAGFCAAIAGVALVLPVVTLTAWLLNGLANDEPLRLVAGLVGNTVVAGTAAALVAVALGLPIAVLAVRWPSRWIRAMEAASFGTYALPGIVVALAVVFLATGAIPALYQTLALLVVAYAVRFLPQAILPAREGLARLSPRLEEAARVLGRSPRAVFREITLPLLGPGLVAAAALVFLTTVKELPMTLILAPTGFRTLATTVWSAVGEGFYARAAAPGLLLIAISIAGVGLLLRSEGADD
jgi:iron(III) transport system permease protein